MSRHTCKRACARVAAVLTTAPVLCLGLVAPSASAATEAGTVGSVCHTDPRDGGYHCDPIDSASGLSSVLDGVDRVLG
ncbi:hypothetical protein NGB36_01150 [Streptomyces sp. RB6PN25]|uniref:Chaplin domain-containing protein n=1 Tax=Streptomyces humicola TaxID=2953240 RepID=A0ABT1PRS2_9ACTN|nr:hypothetical protein [Streptomyces humicola]MCQ4079252.1 hypothetical protein [Streptomyces humicola]